MVGELELLGKAKLKAEHSASFLGADRFLRRLDWSVSATGEVVGGILRAERAGSGTARTAAGPVVPAVLSVVVAGATLSSDSSRVAMDIEMVVGTAGIAVVQSLESRSLDWSVGAKGEVVGDFLRAERAGNGTARTAAGPVAPAVLAVIVVVLAEVVAEATLSGDTSRVAMDIEMVVGTAGIAVVQSLGCRSRVSRRSATRVIGGSSLADQRSRRLERAGGEEASEDGAGNGDREL